MKELMIYHVITSDGDTVWGLYKRNADGNWTWFYHTGDGKTKGLITVMNYAIDYCADCMVFYDGTWFTTEQLKEKMYEVLDSIGKEV